MPTVVYTALPRVIFFFALLSLAGMKFVHADALTGEMQDDAKDLLPPSAQPPPPASGACGDSVDFVPLPRWARGAELGPTPDVLKPMGRKVVLTVPPTPATEPAALSKNNAPGSGMVNGKPLVVTPGPATPPAPTPALIAVSPFLDWIKANPQAAAERARQQASAYQAAADPNAPATPSPTALPGSAAQVIAAPAPYWMPPLIDSANFGTGNVSGSSAAIYSTPQR